MQDQVDLSGGEPPRGGGAERPAAGDLVVVGSDLELGLRACTVADETGRDCAIEGIRSEVDVAELRAGERRKVACRF